MLQETMLKTAFGLSRTIIRQERKFAARVSSLNEFEFTPAKASDLPRILDLAKNDFISAAPLSGALGITGEQAAVPLEWLISKCLRYPYSLLITEKATDQLIGFRLMSLGHRDRSLDWPPFNISLIADARMRIILGIMEQLKMRLWEIKPDVQKVLRRDVTFVTRRHQRKGIASHLIHLNLDFAQLKASGIDGIVSEATSTINQRLLAANGYEHLADLEEKAMVDEEGKAIFPGGHTPPTSTVKLMFRPL